MSLYRLRIETPDATQELDLLEGTTLIGRSGDCTLILDHPLVSRHHAMLQIDGARIQLRDLGSRNGCLLNGKRMSSPADLGVADRFRIGVADFEIVGTRRASNLELRSELRRAQTAAMETVYVDVEPARSEATTLVKPQGSSSAPAPRNTEEGSGRTGDYLEVVGPVAEKALALGRSEEAARLLGGHLERLAEAAQRGQRAVPEVANLAAEFATRLAESTVDPKWIGIALQVFIAERRPLPLDAIDRLYGVMRRLPGAHRPLLDEYVRVLQARKDALSPAERFALQRLEGLARVAAL